MKKLKVFSILTAPLALMALGLALASCTNPTDYSPTTYTVTFNANGGRGTAPNSQKAQEGSSITLPSGSGLSKSGYTFGGWNTKADGAGTAYTAGSSYKPTGDITLYANWNAVAVTYTVTFNLNGGSGTAPAAQTVTSGSSITLPGGSGLTRTGHTFGDWNTNASGTGTAYSAGSSYTPTANITLYAKWDTVVVTTYTITFNINDGTGTAPAAQTANDGSSITLPGGSGLSRSGFTFGGWNTKADGTGTNYSGGSSFTVQGDITLYAFWNASTVTYSVSFNANSGSGTPPSAQTVQAGSSITLPGGSGLSKSGYTFGGWNTNASGTGDTYQSSDSYTPTANSTLYAQWDAVVVTTYTVTFDINGGSGTASAAQTANAGSSITLPDGSGLSKSGYTFGSWNTDVAGTGTNYSAGASYTPTGNITLYAKWNPITYTVIYNKNATDATGTMTNSSHTYDIEKVLNANVFTHTGYTFDGWARTAGGAVEFSNDQSVKNLTAVAGATVTLYAVWVYSSTVWTVTFETNGGSAIGDAVILRNTPVSRPAPDPSRTGYTFDNWFTNPELTTLYNFSSIVIRDTTLYAKWNPITYTVAYEKNTVDADGDMTDSDHTYDVNKNINTNAFTRTGYTFAGWARTTGGAIEFTDGATVKNLTATAGTTITLYAKWTLNRYTITFNANGGTPVPSQQTVDHGGEVTEPASMTRTGYTFDGWFKETALTNQWNFVDDIVTANTTLYAKWDPITYDVAYNANDGTGTMTNSAHTYDIDKNLNTNTFICTGYTFGGWASTSTGAVEFTDGANVKNLASTAEATITLYAQWNPITYTVIYDKNAAGANGTMTNSAHTYDIDKNLNTNTFTRIGYTFGGWASTSTGAVEFTNGQSVKNLTAGVGATVTLYAKWTLNQYTVTFNANSGTPAPSQQTIDHDGKVTQPAAMTRTGYTFDGWFKEAALTNQWNFAADTVTANTTLYAKWTPNTAGITLDVKQIVVDGAPIIAPITISRTNDGYPVTYNVSVNASDYDAGSITWKVAGVGAYASQTVTGSGGSFTLNAAEVKYNSLGGHVLILTVTKGGQQYQRAIPFTIVR